MSEKRGEQDSSRKQNANKYINIVCVSVLSVTVYTGDMVKPMGVCCSRRCSS